MSYAVQIKPDNKTGLVAQISKSNLGHTEVKARTVLLMVELDAQFKFRIFQFHLKEDQEYLKA